ncbi:MAG: xanthine dehydrogenase family protein molybdopterin-binding subunit [Actinomycetota bacterium]
MAAAGSILGNAVIRKEDPGLLVGVNEYCDDMQVDAKSVAFVRSTIAHGTISSINTEDAEGMPGVIAIYTSDNTDLPAVKGFDAFPDTFDRPSLAKGKVKFVGDIIAMVVAETQTQAVDAAEAVWADIDALDAVIDMETAAAQTPIHEGTEANVCFATNFPLGEDGAPIDIDALEGADHVATVKMLTQRLAGAPMENNGAVAIPNDPEGGVTLWCSHQAPHNVQGVLAALLGLEPEKVRAVTPWVGGGFGPKAAFYNEFHLCAFAALELGMPIKWSELRSENMVSMVHGRGMWMEAKLGVMNDGKIVGYEANVTADAGAYPALGAILPMLTQLLAPAVYEMPKVKFNGISVMTNTTTIGAYRGAGRPEATQLIERVLDVAAAEIGMDPAEIRRVNFLQPDAFPLTTITGANYDSGEYERALDAVLDASGYSGLREEQAARRSSGDAKQIGIGVSAYVETTAPIGLHVEWTKVEVNDDGEIDLYAGTSVHGQGHDTAFSMIASSILGVPMDKINHYDSDTASVPRGAGTLGSRSLQTAGSGVFVGSEKVLEKAKNLAAHLLEASVDDMEATGDGLAVAGVPTSSLTWAELAAAAKDESKLPEGMEPGLSYEHDFDGEDSTYPFGAHVSVVEVDTETGGVEILRHIAVDDCGTILNPVLVAGQQHGGIAQGIAQVLFEEVTYDEYGNPQNGNLMDYLVPAASELPSFEASNTETASPRNPLGAKGIGESGTIGSTPALHNAVVDAVAHMGVKHIDMPCTPKAVYAAISAAQS